jgi:hypothetical protein
MILLVKRHNGDSFSGFLLGILDSSAPIDDDDDDGRGCQSAAEILCGIPGESFFFARLRALEFSARLRLVMRFILVIPDFDGLRERMKANAAAAIHAFLHASLRFFSILHYSSDSPVVLFNRI